MDFSASVGPGRLEVDLGPASQVDRWRLSFILVVRTLPSSTQEASLHNKSPETDLALSVLQLPLQLAHFLDVAQFLLADGAELRAKPHPVQTNSGSDRSSGAGGQ